MQEGCEKMEEKQSVCPGDMSQAQNFAAQRLAGNCAAVAGQS